VDDVTRSFGDGTVPEYFSASDHAVFLAAKAVAHATGFLDGRIDAEALGKKAEQFNDELKFARNPATNGILDPVKMLATAMSNAAAANGEPLQDRWHHVMGQLVELIRHISSEMRQATEGK
jgi:hypothetical protein